MEKITATNREFLNLYKGLEAVKSMQGARFAVLVGKNMKELRTLLNPLEISAIPTPQFQQLSIEIQKLIEAEDKEAIEAMEKENEELIKERKKQLAEVEAQLDNESEIYLHVIKEDQLPEDITGEQVERLLQIIS